MRSCGKKILGASLLLGLTMVGLILLSSGAAQADWTSLLPSTDEVNKAKDIFNTGKKVVEKGQKVVKATEHAMTDLTTEQEYYLGRAVAATILKEYLVYPDKNLNAYLNLVGKSLASASDRPQTFGGYHFVVLDSWEINAFAAPGGLIMVTLGMLEICDTEAELAAVLAHEVGHVQGKHGEASIHSSRWSDLGGLLMKEGIHEYGNGYMTQLTNLFGESVGDVSKTLMVNGYSRSQETEADEAAVAIMHRLGYPPQAMVSMLKKMKKAYPGAEGGFTDTHPDPLDRIEDVEVLVPMGAAPKPPKARAARFKKAMASL